MSASDHASAFPFFEELNFAEWLIQFKAHLRRYDADEVLDTPIPTDRDANGVPIVMNARDRQLFDRELAVNKAKDKLHIQKLGRLAIKI
jgi:hypothetical protein